MNTTTRRMISTAAAAGVLSLATAVPVAAEPVWIEPAAPTNGATSSQPETVIHEVRVDDDAWEYVQLGLGALVGVTLVGAAGAAGVALRRRAHHAPHPA